ncbi:MAG: amidohydrolase family protein [Clostridiales bacterium]|nr:amidohydrolase family protein [Clostridiales bacterium]
MNGYLILHGDIVEAPSFGKLNCVEYGYLVAKDGRIVGVYKDLPEEYEGQPVTDLAGSIIMPSFCDMHLHAPQYPLLGLGLDMQLLEWLETYTYPTEARFASNEYASRVYYAFAKDLINGGTTRVAAFSSIHKEATMILMDALERARVIGLVGKVNMDRNCPDYIREDTAKSLEDTEQWIIESRRKYRFVKPAITPRFIPTCSPELLDGLGKLAAKYNIPVQTHLSENSDEINLTRALSKEYAGYWHEYAQHGLFTEGALMAHCVYSDHMERSVMHERNVWAVHCPTANMDLSTGIMPVRRFVYEDINVALGSDVAGGAAIFMPRVIISAIRASKRNWLATARNERCLNMAEAFYLATSAGAKRLGYGGGFTPGDPLHCIVADDQRMCMADEGRSLRERFERLIYRMQPADITHVWSEGERVK